MTDTTASPAPPLPRPYLVWLAGLTVGRLGDATLAFALAWAAAAHGGTTAALVVTAAGLPRLVLLLVGGAVADRLGARRLLVGGEAVLLAVVSALAVALTHAGPAPWLLLTASLTLGAVTAVCLPATGSMPRRLVPDDLLTRALALRQGANQTVLLVAAPLGGLLLGVTGPAAVAWSAAGASAVSLVVLVAVHELDGATRTARPGSRLGLLDGVRVVLSTPGLRSALLLTGAGAALLLPLTSLVVPLLGRSAGWGPGVTGAVAGAVGVGTVAAALLASRRRGPWTGTAPVGVALTVAAVGAAGLALGGALAGPTGAPSGTTTPVVVAAASGLLLGLGNGAFAARLAPVVLGSAPRTYLARVQAVVGLAQVLPVLVVTPALGALVERTAPACGAALTAAGLAACAAWAHRRFPA